MRLALPVEDWAPPFKTGFARSKAKAMDPEIARNQNYDDHYANDSEDVHSALLPFHDDSARRARTPYVSAAIKLIASFRHRWLGSTEASKHKSLLSPPPISPIAAPSEEQKEHEDNKNEIHIFLQNISREISPLHMWCRITIHQPRILPTTTLTGAVMRPHPISIFSLPTAAIATAKGASHNGPGPWAPQSKVTASP